MRIVYGALMLMASCCSVGRGDAQYLYMAVNGSAAIGSENAGEGDSLSVDIWLRTDKNRDDTASTVSSGGEGATLFSYEFVVRADGGLVEWLSYTNAIKEMTYPFPSFESPTEFYAGYGGLTPLAPGGYKLGRLTYRIKSGNPSLSFAQSSGLGLGLRTSFGSTIKGRDGDHTLKYAPVNASTGGSKVGDWSDVDGIEAGSTSLSTAPTAGAPKGLRFGVSIMPNPANPQSLISVTKTRPGPARIQVFNVAGRLISTLLNTKSLPAGAHSFEFPRAGVRDPGVATGVYFVRIATDEGDRVLKLVIMK